MSKLKYLREILDKEECDTIILRCENVEYLIRIAEAGLNLWHEVDLCGAASIDAHFGIADVEDAFSKFQKTLEGSGE